MIKNFGKAEKKVAETRRGKNRNILHIMFAITLTIILSLSTLALTGCGEAVEREATYKALDITPSSEYALRKYTLDELEDKKITLREDKAKVTKRNLPRAKTRELDDTFTLPNGASITFDKYPQYAGGVNISSVVSENLNYYKYMLLRQGQTLMDEMFTRSKTGTLTPAMIYKHKGADGQYGEIKGTDNAVEKVIIIDPKYRSLHASGLYIPPGEAVSIKVENLDESKAEKIGLCLSIQDSLGAYSGVEKDYIAVNDQRVLDKQYDKVTISGQYVKNNVRLPVIAGTCFYDKNDDYVFGTPFGGQLHFDVSQTTSPIKITISGAVETPHFILGVTTNEYFNEYLINAPGVVGTIDTENGQLVGESKYMRGESDMRKVALMWHSTFAVNETFSGGKFDSRNLVTFDCHVPAGAAVSLGGGRYACPSGWFGNVTNYEGIRRNGAWGIFHEIAHQHSSAHGVSWGLGAAREGEVRNNAITVLIYISTMNIGSYKNGDYIGWNSSTIAYENLLKTLSPKADIKLSDGSSKPVTDYEEYSYSEMLTAYVNLMHSFGVDKYYELLYSYKANKSYCASKRADFVYRCATIYGLNFFDYFNNLYMTGVKESDFSATQWSEMNALTRYSPIASLYASGIDGLHTSGDLFAPYGERMELDIEGKTISNEPFEIVDVAKPKYGGIAKENGKYYYTPPRSIRQTDSMEYTVKQANGQTHVFNITFRLKFNGAKTETYFDVVADDFESAQNIVSSRSPDISEKSKVAGVSSYKDESGKKRFAVSTFSYVPLVTGEYTFYLKGDDMAKFYLGRDTLEEKIFMPSYGGYREEYKSVVTLEKGVVYHMRVENYNNGGIGSANLGLRQGSNIVDLSTFYLPDFSERDILTVANYSDREQDQFYISSFTDIGGSESMQLVSAKSDKVYVTDGWTKDDLQVSGMSVNGKDQKMVIKFRGDSIALFATLGKGYGSANVRLDGKNVGAINLDSAGISSRQEVMRLNGLKPDKEHTLEIITNGEGLFNMDFMSLNYNGGIFNAPNIYLERGLTIALVIIAIAFALIVTFVLLLYFCPAFSRFAPKPRANIERKAKPEKVKVEYDDVIEQAVMPKPKKTVNKAQPKKK